MPPETAAANAPEAPTTPAEQPVQKPVEKPLVPALDFVMRSFLNAKKVRLSDFQGKTVILYFWGIAAEHSDVAPSRAEQLFALSKQYDPKKVALLLVSEDGVNSDSLKLLKEAMDPNPALDRGRGYSGRIYPREIYGLEGQGAEGRAIAAGVFEFYCGSKNLWRHADRVTVISPAQQVVGALDFEQDRVATQLQFDKHIGGADTVFDFDKEAFEDLMAQAMEPQL